MCERERDVCGVCEGCVTQGMVVTHILRVYGGLVSIELECLTVLLHVTHCLHKLYLPIVGAVTDGLTLAGQPTRCCPVTELIFL